MGVSGTVGTAAALLAASVLVFMTGGVSGTGRITTPPPSASSTTPALWGDNVCSRDIIWYGYTYRNVSRLCYAVERVHSCEEGEDDHRGRTWYDTRYRRHHRARRSEHSDWDDDDDDDDYSGLTYHRPCYVIRRKTCTQLVRDCVRYRKTEYFCCQGTEADERGHCGKISACSRDNGGCEQLCVHDEYRGHYCTCFPGYDLYEDIHCVDLDECAVDNGGCDHTCHNIEGDHYCSCRNGYKLTGPTNCTAINECDIGNGGCQQTCVNTEEAFYCDCEDGFQLTDGYRCLDVNECETHNGGCSHECVNRNGFFYCLCPPGMSLDEGGEQCLCAEGFVVSQDGASCIPESEFSGPNDEPVIGDGEQGLPLALILGIAGAGFLFLLILIIVACCCARRCRRRRAADAIATIPMAAAVQAVPAVIIKVPIYEKDKKKKDFDDDDDEVVEAAATKVDSAEVWPQENMNRVGMTPPTYTEAVGYNVPRRAGGDHGYDVPVNRDAKSDVTDYPESYLNPGYEHHYEDVKTPPEYASADPLPIKAEQPQETPEKEERQVSVSDKIKQFQDMMNKK